MKNKTKTDADSLLRIPKAKNKLGLKIHKIAMPHDDLIRAEAVPHLEIVENSSMTTQSSHTTQPSHSTQPSQTRLSREIAPIKDFQKTPNSITRRAIPDGLFRGKSKQLYDALYSLTRGAINPARHTRIRKSKLMKLADIGSRATFDSNINHLQFVGLIRETILPGEHEGNKFEVFLPEETPSLTSMPSQSSLASQAGHAQKPDSLVSLETTQTRQGLQSINTGIPAHSKTSSKDNTRNDDEKEKVLWKFAEKFDQVSRKLTGKGLSGREAEKWENLADILILQLEVASKKTDTISSIPAFLTEVLRRKLLGGNSSAAGKATRTKPDTVGKPNEAGEYEKKSLSKEGREAALLELQDFAGEEFLEDFKKWYTPEDWSWLTAELDKINQAQKNEPGS